MIFGKIDKAYTPFYQFINNYKKSIEKLDTKQPYIIALEREQGIVVQRMFEIDESHPDTFHYVERTLKFMLWAYGGFRVHIFGSKTITDKLSGTYSKEGARKFDIELMERVYGEEFEIIHCQSEFQLPKDNENSVTIGGHFEGERIGFDLGASDYKISAVKDGEVVFSEEIPWNPIVESDPDYHFKKLNDGLKKASKYLSRVDAIGGSSAGILINNQFKIASLFRAVPEDLFEQKVKTIFTRLQQKWNVPIITINDGDVTALSGALSLEVNNILGVAMGSSEAVGYINKQGRVTGRLNELAFAPVDVSANAAIDEWSKDFGLGVQYFSQQGVNKLALMYGFEFPEEMGLPERLKEVQAQANKGNTKAWDIFLTIGDYLGHTIPLYHEFYSMDHLLILGRVTSGTGGELILKKAKEVLEEHYPELFKKIEIHIPTEKMRRVGQSIAAASLPETKGI